MTTYYLRQGAWCDCERSCNTADGSFEQGISVFEAIPIFGHWQGTGVAWQKRLCALRGQHHTMAAGGQFYLVSGERVGTGSDAEPLVKNVVALKEVAWNGVEYFEEVSACLPKQIKLHPHHPDCRCYGADELDELNEYELSQERVTDAEDVDVSDIEF